ncbi:signal peptidase I [Elusimicrobiota bacterium]
MGRTSFIVIIAVAIAFFFRTYCFEVIYIATPSMEPAYPVKQQLLVNKMAYKFVKPKRGDVVMFHSPVEDKDLVKRIIGLPGEDISIENKEVFINGEWLVEDYVQLVRPDSILVGDNIESMTIFTGEYFVMGDNRDVSRDSRDWSEEPGMQCDTVNLKKIKGKVIYSF